MNPLAFGAVLAQQLLFFGGPVGHVAVRLFNKIQLNRNHGKHKKVRGGLVGQKAKTKIGEVYLIVLFFDREVQGLIDFFHLLALVLQVEAFGFLQKGLIAVFREKLDERLVLGQRSVRTQQLKTALGLVAIGQQFLGLRQGILGYGLLLGNEGDYKTFEGIKLLLVAVGRGSAND